MPEQLERIEGQEGGREKFILDFKSFLEKLSDDSLGRDKKEKIEYELAGLIEANQAEFNEQLADQLIDEGLESFVFRYINVFPDSCRNEVIKKIINKALAESDEFKRSEKIGILLDRNHPPRPNLNLEIATFLIEKGMGREVARNASEYCIEEDDYSRLAEALVDKGQSGIVETNLGNFRNLTLEVVERLLESTGNIYKKNYGGTWKIMNLSNIRSSMRSFKSEHQVGIKELLDNWEKQKLATAKEY